MLGATENLIATVTTTTTTISSGISSGTYYFKVAAINDHGEGPRSSTITVLAASVPTKMNPVVINHPTDITSVRITWAAPTSNGGDAITAY